MSFIADKKREHETAAAKALVEKDYGTCFFHTAKAAEFGFALAEQSAGRLGQRYADDAFELLAIAEELKAKAVLQAPDGAHTAITQAIGEADAAARQWQLREKPTERLADVAGLDAVKLELKEKAIEPFQHPEAYQRFKVAAGGGVLLYGPPGNGKTFIARATAGELDAAFYNCTASQVKEKYVGETEKRIQGLFDTARQQKRAVIFIDEVDHLLGRRGNRKIGTVAQFLTAMDGLVKNTNCLLVLGATNKPWMLDGAVIRPGRMGTHIYVGPPDLPARKSILAYNLREVPMTDGFNWDGIAEKTDGFSGADVAALCDRAKRAALRRQLAGDKGSVVAEADFAEALEKVKPSVTPAMLADFERWRDSRAEPGTADERND